MQERHENEANEDMQDMSIAVPVFFDELAYLGQAIKHLAILVEEAERFRKYLIRNVWMLRVKCFRKRYSDKSDKMYDHLVDRYRKVVNAFVQSGRYTRSEIPSFEKLTQIHKIDD